MPRRLCRGDTLQNLPLDFSQGQAADVTGGYRRGSLPCLNPYPYFYFMTMKHKKQGETMIKWQKHPKFTPIELVGWLVGLVIFGWFYNKWVDVLYERGQEHVKTDRLVIWGVMVTMLPATRFLTPWEFIRIALLFCASSSMVILGHQRRLLAERRLNQSYQKALRNAKKL